jgi:hypothetical protein
MSETKNAPSRRCKNIYIPKEVAEVLWSRSRNRTRINFGQYHFCNPHQCKVDNDHIATCDLIDLDIPLAEYVEKSLAIKY